MSVNLRLMLYKLRYKSRSEVVLENMADDGDEVSLLASVQPKKKGKKAAIEFVDIDIAEDSDEEA